MSKQMAVTVVSSLMSLKEVAWPIGSKRILR